MENQIIHLREECNSKTLLINLILESVFKNNIPKVTSYTNSNILLTPNENYQFPQRFSKNYHGKSSYNSYAHDNRFHALSVHEDIQNNNQDLHVTESPRETLHSDDNQNQKYSATKTNGNQPVNRKELKKKLPVTIILRDSIVKEVKAGEISEENNKVVQNSSVDLLLMT